MVVVVECELHHRQVVGTRVRFSHALIVLCMGLLADLLKQIMMK